MTSILTGVLTVFVVGGKTALTQSVITKLASHAEVEDILDAPPDLNSMFDSKPFVIVCAEKADLSAFHRFCVTRICANPAVLLRGNPCREAKADTAIDIAINVTHEHSLVQELANQLDRLKAENKGTQGKDVVASLLNKGVKLPNASKVRELQIRIRELNDELKGDASHFEQ
jgi:hypothetical protein